MFDVIKWATHGELRTANLNVEDFHKNWVEERGEEAPSLATSLRNNLIRLADNVSTYALTFTAFSEEAILVSLLIKGHRDPWIVAETVGAPVGAAILYRYKKQLFRSIYRHFDIT